MKGRSIILFLMLFSSSIFAGELIKDWDGDGRDDYVGIKGSKIIARLSSSSYEPVVGKLLDNGEDVAAPQKALAVGGGNGFTYLVSYMRSGYRMYFRYDSQERAFRLIGADFEYFGNLAGSGREEVSVNLLARRCSSWQYSYSLRRKRLEKFSKSRKI